MPIFERLTIGWVNEDVGLLFLLYQVVERGNITWLGAGLPTVVGRRTGIWPQVIAGFQNWVVTVGFDDGRSWCWGRPPCTQCGSDWGGRHRLGGGLSGVFAAGTIVTLGGNSVVVSLGTLVEGAGQSGWKATAGAKRGAMGAGAVGVISVTLEKMQESVWMAANLSLPSVANEVEVVCKRAWASAQAATVAELVELPDGSGQLGGKTSTVLAICSAEVRGM